MAHAFVLIDALSGHEDEVFDALSRISSVVSKRQLSPKVGSADLLVLLEGKDMHEIDTTIAGRLRGMTGIYSVQRMMPQHTVLGNLPKLMAEMEREVAARGRS